MSKRIFARRLLALTLSYAVALQALLPFALAAVQGPNAVICVSSATAGKPAAPAPTQGSTCPCVTGCAIGWFVVAVPPAASEAPAAVETAYLPRKLAGVMPHGGKTPQAARAPPAA